MAQIEESIARYLADRDTADWAEPEVAELKKGRLQAKIAALQEHMQHLKALEAQMLARPDQQLSPTDSDARSMKNRDGGIVGYNVQTAVDAKHVLAESSYGIVDAPECPRQENGQPQQVCFS